MHFVAFAQQQFGQIRPVLSGDACNQSFFHITGISPLTSIRDQQEVLDFIGVMLSSLMSSTSYFNYPRTGLLSLEPAVSKKNPLFVGRVTDTAHF